MLKIRLHQRTLWKDLKYHEYQSYHDIHYRNIQGHNWARNFLHSMSSFIVATHIFISLYSPEQPELLRHDIYHRTEYPRPRPTGGARPFVLCNNLPQVCLQSTCCCRTSSYSLFCAIIFLRCVQLNMFQNMSILFVLRNYLLRCVHMLHMLSMIIVFDFAQ